MELRFVFTKYGKDIRKLGVCRRENTTGQRNSKDVMAVITRSYNLYSDVQRADDTVVTCYPKLAKSISRRSRK